MRRTFLTTVTILALAGTMLISPGGSALASGPSGAQEAAGPMKKGAKRERHPEIRMAIRHLEAAKVSLQKGAHDFQGHRAKALELTDQALKECHDALEADKK